MADILYFAGVRVLTTNAQPGAGYVARFYNSGTTSPVTVYTDSTLGTPHGTFVTADAAGKFAAVWSSGGLIKCVIEDADAAIVQTIDPVFSSSSAASAAGDISFTPTVDLPYTNVQDAIEGAVTAAASGFGPFGLGITGNATLLANIDATNIGAGTYRFDNTTTGTYPTGVAAADTGLVEHWRQAAATAMQFLYHATTDRVFHRRMAASAWGAWREVITSNQAPAEGDILYRGASAWTRLAKGTAGQRLRMNSGATAPEWGVTEGTLTSTASGGPYSINITAGVRKITVLFDRCSLDSTGNWFVQIGPSSGVVTTGYESTSGTRASGTNATNGFIIQAGVAAAQLTGSMVIELVDSATNLWVSRHTLGTTAGGDGTASGGGRIALAGGLERFRLTFTAANNPDFGQFRIVYE